MKQIFSLFLLALSLSACTNLNKFNRFVNQKYSANQLTSFDYKTDLVNVSSAEIVKQDSLCRTERIKAIFIPALFYWYWNNTIKCTIDPKFYAQRLEYDLKIAAETSNIREKLNGNKINISIKSFPSSFIYMNKGHLLFALLSYAMIYKEGIAPLSQNMILDFEILKNDTVVRKNTIEIPNNNVFIKNSWNSRKKLTWQYLDDYENNLKKQSSEAILKISNDL